MDIGEAPMGFSEIIAREAETMPAEKQAEILDYIAFLKTRQPLLIAHAPAFKDAAEIEAFFRSFKVDLSGYRFDRDEANAR